VGVDWSAGGTPLSSLDEYPPIGEPQVWSGYTVWKVVDSKVVQMWTFNVTGPLHYLTDDDRAW
jgi:hypothetical protein